MTNLNNTHTCDAAVEQLCADQAQDVALTVEADQLKSLANVIADAAIKRGIISGQMPLTGPQLIALCADLAEPSICDEPEGRAKEIGGSDTQTVTMTAPRAFIRQRSGRHLNLLDPSPDGWTDEDLAIGLSRTFRWGGHSAWPLPLSVAQHSLMVLALATKFAAVPLTRSESLRELLHDADESLIGGFDPVSPVKPFLGPGFLDLTTRLQQAVFTRYKLPPWTLADHKAHKYADILAAASEAVHVAGWSINEVRDILKISLPPLITDPLAEIYDCQPWEPWTPNIAADRFLAELTKQERAPDRPASPPAPRAFAIS